MRWDWLSGLKYRLRHPRTAVSQPRRLPDPGLAESLEARCLLSVTASPAIDAESLAFDLPYRIATTLPAPSALPIAETTTGNAPFPLDETFELHSLPESNYTIYLDFDGHVTNGTPWNNSFGNDLVTPRYDRDGDTSSFSDAELEEIQYIWLRTLEDFAPFDVNVTTQEPSDLGDLMKTGNGDTRWGVRVSIGGSSADWFGSSAGGVAFIGSFSWSTDTPVYTWNGGEKPAAETNSHEVGHALFLGHDGDDQRSYYSGHGSGTTSWGPIMGASFFPNVTQWSKGEYLKANNQEDDLQIIVTRNGFDYREDDFGSDFVDASPLPVGQDSVSVDFSGVIERNTDNDVFTFRTGDGPVDLSITEWFRGPNLDILAELYDVDGNLVASSNPADELNARIQATLTVGDYFLSIDGVGAGDLATGYTDYGSIGQYTVTGTIVEPPVTDVFVLGNDVIVQDRGDGIENLHAVIDGNLLVVSSLDQPLKAGPGAVQVDPRTATVDLDTVTGTIRFDNAGENDVVSIDFSGGFFPLPINVDGGTGLNTVRATDGDAGVVTHRRIGSDGEIQIQSASGTGTITYTNVGRIDDSLLAVHRRFDFVGGSEAITLNDNFDPVDGLMELNSGPAESILFEVPTSTFTLTTDQGSGTDSVTLAGFDQQFDVAMTVTGDSDDIINLQGQPYDRAQNPVELTAGSIGIFDALGSPTSTGLVTLTADMFTVAAPISGRGLLNIRPLDEFTTIGLGDNTSGALHLDGTELANVFPGFSHVSIGDPVDGAGQVEIDGAAFRSNVSIYGNAISVTGLSATGRNVELVARDGSITSGGDIVLDVDAETVRLVTHDPGDLGDRTIGRLFDPISVAAMSLNADSNFGRGEINVEVAGSIQADSLHAAAVNIHGGEFILGPGALFPDVHVDLAPLTASILDLNGLDTMIRSLTGDGEVRLGGNRLTVDQGFFFGTISGAGGITKVGPDVLYLGGANTFTGEASLVDGDLIVDGIITSEVGIGGGFLGGIGTVFGNVVGSDNGGGVIPGGFAGTLTVDGDVILDNSQQFVVGVEGIGPGFFGQLLVEGTDRVVVLDEARLLGAVDPGFVPVVGDSITIIDLVDPTSQLGGTFAGLPEGAALELPQVGGGSGSAFQISYAGGDGNDVTLEVVATAVRVFAAPGSVIEDSGDDAVFTFERFGSLAGDLTVQFTADGTATADDYTLTGVESFDGRDGTIVIPDGVSQVEVMLTPIEDALFEFDETAILRIRADAGYKAGRPLQAGVEIENDDVGVSVSAQPTQVDERGSDSIIYTFVRHESVAGEIQVIFSVSGTASLGVDYDLTGAASLGAASGVVVFEDGVESVSISVTPIDDETFEPVESVVITVLDGVGFDPAEPAIPSTAEGFIINEDDHVPTIDPIDDYRAVEDDPEHTIRLFGISSGTTDDQPVRVSATSNRQDVIPNPIVLYTDPLASADLKFTPVTDAFGEVKITVTVEDAGLDLDFDTPDDNLIKIETFFIRVQPINDAPTLAAINDVTVDEDDGLHHVDLAGMTPGPKEHQPFRVEAWTNEPSIISGIEIEHVPGSPEGRLHFRTAPDAEGTAMITVRVTDGGVDHSLTSSDDNLAIDRTFTVTIEGTNDAPKIDRIDSVVIDEDSGEHTVTLTGISGGIGEDQEVMISAASSDLSIVGAVTVDHTPGESTAMLRFTPEPNAFGTLHIDVVVEDGGDDDDFGTPIGNASTNARFGVGVRPVNDSPTAPDLVINDVPEHLAVGTVLGQVVPTDVDNDRWTFAIIDGNTEEALAIRLTTGEIVVHHQSALDFETNPVFNLTVAVMDQGEPVEVNVQVNLLDVNEGDLIIQPGDWLSESLTVRLDGGTLNVVDGDGTTVIASAGFNMVSKVLINGRADISDLVVIDFSEGTPVPPRGIYFNGDVGDEDTLHLQARLIDVVERVTQTVLTSDSGHIQVDDSSIEFDGVERINDRLRAIRRVNRFSGADDRVVLDGGAIPGDFVAEIGSPGTAPHTVFRTPIEKFEVDLGAGNDVFEVGSVELGLADRVEVHGGLGDDQFEIAGLEGGLIRINGDDGRDEVVGLRGSHIRILNDRIEAPGESTRTLAFIEDVEGVQAAGGGGNDILDAREFTGDATLFGANGNDYLFGGAGDDVLDGWKHDDHLFGGPGEDILRGGLGKDALDGGAGADLIDGQDGSDRLVSIVAGNAVLTDRTFTLNGEVDSLVSVDKAFLEGSAGDDSLDASDYGMWIRFNAGSGNDTVVGTRNNDILEGGDGNDELFGLRGHDVMFGDDGEDQLSGGPGHDILFGGRDADVIDGAEGNDLIVGEHGHDRLEGKAGNDFILGGGGRDTMSGGRGNDLLRGNGGFDTNQEYFSGAIEVSRSGLNGAAVGSDRMFMVEQVVLTGTNGAEFVHGGGFVGQLVVFAGGGDDTLIGGRGPDVLFGEDGDDRIDGRDGDDILVGNNGNDVITGGNGDDFLIGGNGDDVLDGGNGDDRLRGNNGFDRLRGGAGADLLEGGSNPDTIDGGEGDDTLKGGKGGDILIGGAGNDVVDGEMNSDRGTVAGEGVGVSPGDTLVNVELGLDDAFAFDFDALIEAV